MSLDHERVKTIFVDNYSVTFKTYINIDEVSFSFMKQIVMMGISYFAGKFIGQKTIKNIATRTTSNENFAIQFRITSTEGLSDIPTFILGQTGRNGPAIFGLRLGIKSSPL